MRERQDSEALKATSKAEDELWKGYLPYTVLMAIGLTLLWLGHNVGGMISGLGIVYLGGYQFRHHQQGTSRIWPIGACILGGSACLIFLGSILF